VTKEWQNGATNTLPALRLTLLPIPILAESNAGFRRYACFYSQGRLEMGGRFVPDHGVFTVDMDAAIGQKITCRACGSHKVDMSYGVRRSRTYSVRYMGFRQPVLSFRCEACGAGHDECEQDSADSPQ